MSKLDEHTRIYLTIFACSIAASVVFYLLGGRTGRLFTNDAAQGWGFEIGGAAVGFFVAFMVSARFFNRPQRVAPNPAGPPNLFELRLTLKGRPAFPTRGEFVASYEVHRQGELVRRGETQPDFVGNLLVVKIRDVLPADRIVARVEQPGKTTWEVQPFVIIEPVLDARARTASASATAESRRSLGTTERSLSGHVTSAPHREYEPPGIVNRPSESLALSAGTRQARRDELTRPSTAPTVDTARSTGRNPASSTEEARRLGEGR